MLKWKKLYLSFIAVLLVSNIFDILASAENNETVIYNVAEDCYRAGEERVYGSVRVDVVEYGLLTDTLYINDNTVTVKYNYFVPPTLSYIFMEIVNFVLSIVL